MVTGAGTLGPWIKRRRKALGLTQEELAARVPCSVATIQKIEADERRPSREFAVRLAACLDIPAEQRSAWVSFARAETGSTQQWSWSRIFRPAANLPLSPTPLIGREHDVAAVCKRLLRDDVRLLTLVGPAGIGKTRLALQVAAELRDDFEEGVCFVDLSPISDPYLLAPTIAQTLGLLVAGPRSCRSRLLEFLQDRQLLLLLDNFEQIVAAAGLVSDLLSASPWLKVLVTSRVALRVRGERRFPVPALALPDLAHLPPLESLVQCPAVALFAEVSRAVEPAFVVTSQNAAAVATLCCRLDGLPLAIELIAARSRILSPEMLLSRLTGPLLLHSDGLRDVPERQRTLSAAIGWSHDLLDSRQQALFRRLSVFRGGWTLEAAEAVASDGPVAPTGGVYRVDVLDILAALVNNSLVQRLDTNGQPRFTMLETIREYALGKLEASGEAEAVRQRHAEYYGALCDSAEPHLTDADAQQWLERLEREHDNLRAALRWLLDTRQAERALRLAGALWRFWRKRGHAGEGLEWLEAALDLGPAVGAASGTEETARSLLRAKALVGAGAMTRTLGDYAQAKVFAEESVNLYRTLGDQAGLAYAVFSMGAGAFDLGELPLARSLYHESLALYRQLGHQRGIALLLQVLGALERDEGDLAQAEASFSEVLQLQRERGERYAIAWALLDLGELARIRGAYEQAQGRLQESLALFRELGDHETIAFVLHRLGELAECQGNHAGARISLEESLLLSRKLGFKAEVAAALRILGRVALAEGDAARASELCEGSLALLQETGEKVGRAQSLKDWGRVKLCEGDYSRATTLFSESLAGLEAMGHQVEIPECLEGLAQAWMAQGRALAAAQLLGAAAAMREAMGVPLPPVWCAGQERAVAAVRAALGESAFAVAWAQGRVRSLTDVVALALATEG